MTNSPRSLIALSMLILAGTVRHADAQPVIARSFEALGRLLRPGADITVIELSGAQRSAIVTALTAGELTVVSQGSRYVFRERDVARVEQRRHDSPVNGAAIGFAVGAGTALGMTAIARVANYYVEEGRTARTTLAFRLCGAGIGVLIDALHKSRRTLYVKLARP